MVKKKLQRFAENLTFQHLFQPTLSDIRRGFHLKGKWNQEFFKNTNPIILELGCGKGEYTVGLAEKYPEKNFIGMDIKGARLWKGCKYASENSLSNVAFIRSKIDFITAFFDKGEISELWLTFPDPQLKKAKKRLLSPAFLERYKQILDKKNLVHLKTDSRDLYNYVLDIIVSEKYKLIYAIDDINNSDVPEEVLSIQTFYEKIYLEEGKSIQYLQFELTF